MFRNATAEIVSRLPVRFRVPYVVGDRWLLLITVLLLDSSLRISVAVLLAPVAWLIRTFSSYDRGGP